MKKIIGILTAVSIVVASAGVLAEDLPAELIYADVSIGNSDEGLICTYINSDGRLCYVMKDEDDEKAPKYRIISDSGSFDDIRSLGVGYGVLYKDMISALCIREDGSLWHCTEIDGKIEYTKVEGIENCIKIGMSGAGIIALLSDGTVYTWAQTAVPEYASNVESPISKVDGLENIVDIAAGESYSYALDCDGYIYQWNYDENGIQSVPKKFETDGIFTGISGGYGIILATTNDGDVYRYAEVPYHYENNFAWNEYIYPVKQEGINDCVQISNSPIFLYDMILMPDNRIKFYNVWLELKEYEVTEGEIDHVAASRGAFVIMKDGSLWEAEYGDYHEIEKLKCIVDKDSENKAGTKRSIRFVKRSEMAEKLIEAYEVLTGKQCETAVSSSYTDVSSDSEYKEAIEQCSILGLMDGTDDEGSFSPNKVLRREQAAVILDRLFDISKKEIPAEYRTEKYEDDEEISDWARESVYRTAGLFDRENKFDPQEYVTYDELHEIMQKIIK